MAAESSPVAGKKQKGPARPLGRKRPWRVLCARHRRGRPEICPEALLGHKLPCTGPILGPPHARRPKQRTADPTRASRKARHTATRRPAPAYADSEDACPLVTV